MEVIGFLARMRVAALELLIQVILSTPHQKLQPILIMVTRKTKTKAEALRVIQEFYTQLRSSGFPVNRLHMDRAREFQSAAMETGAAACGIELTRTQGDNPLQNGAAERAVGYIRGRTRVLLSQAREMSKAEEQKVKTWWPFAADTAAAQQQSLTMGKKNPSAARLGFKVFTKRKDYGSNGRMDLLPKWAPATYLGPARTVFHGHLVFTDGGNLWFTTHVRQFADTPDEGPVDEVDRVPDPASSWKIFSWLQEAYLDSVR